MMNAALYFQLAREREAIRRKRQASAPPPWTDDQIFRDWRFCNVHREDDKTTRWLKENIRDKLTGVAVAEAVTIFRWFNRIETGEIVLDLLRNGWDRNEAHRRLSAIKGPLWTGAYRIRGENGKGKLESTLDSIEIARRRLPRLIPDWGLTLERAWRDLRKLPYIGDFMAYEIVSDLRWTDLLSGARDINTWAAAGPGCARGLGWVAYGDSDRFNYQKDNDQARMLPLLRQLLAMSRDPANWPAEYKPWEMREAEHFCCEAAKYVRMRDAGVPPRQRFHAPVGAAV